MNAPFETAAMVAADRIDLVTPVFLKPSVKMEPLLGRWYAWPHLLSPAQQALNLAFRQAPLLESFLANPAIHLAARDQPEMFCGPFLQVTDGDVDFVRELLAQVRRDHAPQIAFAQDLRRLAQALQSRATGQPLDDFYATLPASLQGLIEFVYDTNGRATFRILEELLVRDGFPVEIPPEVSLVDTRDEDRPFFLNTPRPRSSERLDFAWGFDDPRVDVLSALRNEPRSLGDVGEALGLTLETVKALARFTTPEAPRRSTMAHTPTAQDISIKYFGHACLLVETPDTSVLFDPVLAFDPQEGAALTFADLPPRIDLLVLTHNHQDHFSPEILMQLRPRVGRVVVPRNNNGSPADPSMKLALRRLGFAVVEDLDPMDEVTLPGGRLVSIPFLGEHADLDIRSKHGLFLEILGHRILFLADSACLDHHVYRRLSKLLGPIDTLFIGMECAGAPLTWIYGPYLGHTPSRREDEGRRLSGSNAVRAAAIVREMGCKAIYVYAMGQEPWLRYLLGLEYSPESYQITQSTDFIEECISQNLPARRLKGCEILIHSKSPQD